MLSARSKRIIILSERSFSCHAHDSANWFVAFRKRSCLKVMFSQVCVRDSVHSGNA